MKDLFSKQFGPKVYSVLCYGKVGNVEQQLLAIVQEEEKVEQKNQPDAKSADITQQGQEPEKKAPAASKIFQNCQIILALKTHYNVGYPRENRNTCWIIHFSRHWYLFIFKYQY